MGETELFPDMELLETVLSPMLLVPLLPTPLVPLSPTLLQLSPTLPPLLFLPTTMLPPPLSPTLPPLLFPPTTSFLTPATLATTLDTLESLDTTGTLWPRGKLILKLMLTLPPRLLLVFLMPTLWLPAMPTTPDTSPML